MKEEEGRRNDSHLAKKKSQDWLAGVKLKRTKAA